MEASKYADEEENDEVDLEPKEDESEEEESGHVQQDPCKLYKIYILFEFNVFHS